MALLWIALFGQEPGAQKGPILLELFTSQGCSSCPSADRFLAQVQQANPSEVVLLSFHVDYWNYLGWPDPYAQKAFSERQKHYTITLSSQAYTPQVVIDGAMEGVGSDRTFVEMALEKARKHPPARLAIQSDGQHSGRFKLTRHSDQHAWAALLYRERENAVPRGENRGKTLTHRNVVAWLKPVYSSEVEIPKDLDWQAGDLLVVWESREAYGPVTA
ncbi:MAG: DUF1223 domain-containing protein, partial [Acidobacteria bacterium]|nr:DUF1223 domain-containing protein [Acidobacteriota bacterium]